MSLYLKTPFGELYNEDAVEVLKRVPDKSADLIVLDPPYVNFRDVRVEKRKNWEVKEDVITRALEESARIIKDNQPVFLFGFPSFFLEYADAIKKNFRVYFDVIYAKASPTNPFVARIRPMNAHEQILVLVRKDAKVSKMKYYPERIGRRADRPLKSGGSMGKKFGNAERIRKADPYFRYPTTVLTLKNFTHRHGHPTEKPEALLEWIIKGWTDEGDLVIDPFAGSGTTLVVAEKLKRRWIGAEIEKEYCEIIQNRLKELH